jgi:hypothetical protein
MVKNTALLGARLTKKAVSKQLRRLFSFCNLPPACFGGAHANECQYKKHYPKAKGNLFGMRLVADL